MKFRDIARRAKEKASQAVNHVRDNPVVSAAGGRLDQLLKKTGLKKAFDQARDNLPGEAARRWKALSDKLETLGVQDAAREVQQTFTGLSPKDAAEILRDTYKNMDVEEAMKIGAAVVAPGGIPVYVVLKLVEYRQKQKDRGEGPDATPPSSPPSSSPPPGPKA